MCRNDEQLARSKRETWSPGTNWRLLFDVNMILNLPQYKHGKRRVEKIER